MPWLRGQVFKDKYPAAVKWYEAPEPTSSKKKPDEGPIWFPACQNDIPHQYPTDQAVIDEILKHNNLEQMQIELNRNYYKLVGNIPFMEKMCVCLFNYSPPEGNK